MLLTKGAESAALPVDLLPDVGPWDLISAHLTPPRVFVAIHDYVGFPYNLICIDRPTEEVIWKSRVWASCFTGAEGVHMSCVWVTVQDDRVIVFGAGSTGTHVEAFRAEDGAKSLSLLQLILKTLEASPLHHPRPALADAGSGATTTTASDTIHVMPKPRWSALKIGDGVRFVRLPTFDGKPGGGLHAETRRAYQRLIKNRRSYRVYNVDADGLPWVSFRFRRKNGSWEHHWLAINDDSWVRVRKRL